MTVQTILRRPGLRIAGCSLAIVGMTLLITVGQSHLTSPASTASAVLAFLVVMLLFLVALKLKQPHGGDVKFQAAPQIPEVSSVACNLINRPVV
jgi:purine-cytosine permease-like protein